MEICVLRLGWNWACNRNNISARWARRNFSPGSNSPCNQALRKWNRTDFLGEGDCGGSPTGVSLLPCSHVLKCFPYLFNKFALIPCFHPVIWKVLSPCFLKIGSCSLVPFNILLCSFVPPNPWETLIALHYGEWGDIWNVSYIKLRILKSFNPVEVLTFSGFYTQLLKLRS